MPHNHHHCITSATKRAQLRCGKGLTPLRTQVLEALWASHQAQGAYEVLERINAKSTRKLAPLSVYRALDYLLQQGLVHKIESLNAFVGCPHAQAGHAVQVLVCRNCKSVTEIEDARIHRQLQAHTTTYGFTPERMVVEVVGLCATCASH